MKKDVQLTRQRRRWNMRPVTVTCGFCGKKMEIPVYRLWVAKQRGNNIYCGAKCRVQGSRLRLGLPADGKCLESGCDSPVSYGGRCMKHAKRLRVAGKEVKVPARIQVLSRAEYERKRTKLVRLKKREPSS